MADMIQMLDGLNLGGFGCGPTTPSRYSPRLAGFGADLDTAPTALTVESSGGITPLPPPPPSFWETHANELKIAAVIVLSGMYLRIRAKRKSYEQDDYLRDASALANRKRRSGRTMSGSYRLG